MLCASTMFCVVVSAILLSTVTDVQSRYVRHQEIHRSVLHKKVIATWDEAKHRCEAEGAVMASPLDEEMLEYMKSSIGINNHTTPYFIGIRATVNPEFIYASVEGVPLDDLPEAAINMIEQLDPQDGDCLCMDRHNIRVVSCRAMLPYICYKNDTSTSTMVTSVDVTTDSETEVTTPTEDDCSEGYTFLSGSYYKLHLDYTTWDGAQSGCSAEGAHLLVLNDAHEAQIVKDFAFEGIENTWMFIGERDLGNDNWRSVLGDPLDQIYHEWASSRTGNPCGVLKKDGLLDDMNCSYIMPYICEKQCKILNN